MNISQMPEGSEFQTGGAAMHHQAYSSIRSKSLF